MMNTQFKVFTSVTPCLTSLSITMLLMINTMLIK
jgi:hypothetical protein